MHAPIKPHIYIYIYTRVNQNVMPLSFVQKYFPT